jgi:histidine ammonia-lyase
MGHYFNPSIVTNGLILSIDASNKRSYPGSGTDIFDLSGKNAHAVINGTVPFVGAGSSSYWNFATAASTNYISSTLSQPYLDCTIVFYPDFTLNNNASLVGLIAASNDATNTDKSMRFGNANGSGPWTVKASSGLNTDDWGYLSTTYYVNGAAVADGASLRTGWNILGAYRTNQSVFPSSFSYFLGTEGFSGAVRDFQGRIAMCLMYDRQLSAAEHTKNYNALKGRFRV